MLLYFTTTVKKISLIFLCFLFSILAGGASAQTSLPHEALAQQAEAFITAALPVVKSNRTKTSVVSMPLDPRLNIQVCDTPYIFTTNTEIVNQTSITVKAECANTSWYLYFVVKVSRTQAVVVSTQALSPGTLVAPQHVTYADIDITHSRQTLFFDTDDVVGTKVKRRLRAKQPLLANQLCYVCKGDNVSITSGSKLIAVKTLGIAQQDGVLGDTINVTNQRSGKTVRGRVVGVAAVQTGM